ncbi:MAG: hypothetical protein ACLQOO_04805 [Terriglobia bacterium]
MTPSPRWHDRHGFPSTALEAVYKALNWARCEMLRRAYLAIELDAKDHAIAQERLTKE